MTSLEHMSDFALSLRRESNIEGSSVCSPLSIGLVLALLHAGANGASKTQIAHALANGPTDDDLRRLLLKSKQPPSYFAGALTAIGPEPSSSSDPPNVDVLVATRLYVRVGLSIEPNYLAVIKKNYDAIAKIVDFTNANEAAATINGFVKETTQDKIWEIIEANLIEKDTAAVVVNAICFNGKWEKKFKLEKTTAADFFPGGGAKRTVQMMYQTATFMYAETKEVQVLSMKYVDGSYAYDVFLPKENFGEGGLDAFLDGLTGTKMQELLKSMTAEPVRVGIPKSRIETNLNLKETFKKLGILDVFNPSAADLSGISNDKKKHTIYVSRIMHKAVIEVDEEGTTAAAASTGVPYADSPRFTKIFECNRPYLFVLSRGGAPLFAGVYR